MLELWFLLADGWRERWLRMSVPRESYCGSDSYPWTGRAEMCEAGLAGSDLFRKTKGSISIQV